VRITDDSKVARTEHDVVLRLDRATAEDLYAALYELGEHIAAGPPITPPTAGEVERLRVSSWSPGRGRSPPAVHRRRDAHVPVGSEDDHDHPRLPSAASSHRCSRSPEM
jgi:hypothetical protein